MRHKVNRRALNGDGDPKNNNAAPPFPPAPPFKQHNRTIEAPLPFPHCLISAGYLRYLCGCSYLWPSACCSAAPAHRRHLHHFAPAPTYQLPQHTHTHPPHASVLRPSEGCHYSLTHLTSPSCGMCICRIGGGSTQYGVRWSTYRNMTWHALSNGERWRRNSCWCCRKQSGRDWIKVSGKGPLDGLLFSPIQLDVSLSCQEGITAGWFINTWSDLAATLHARVCVCMYVCVCVCVWLFWNKKKRHKVEYFQNSWHTRTKTWLDLEQNSPFS